MSRAIALTLALMAAIPGAAPVLLQQPQTEASTAALKTAIDHLGDFDHAIRTDAARTMRRGSAAVAVPMLVAAARSHTDEYVRYRALTLLSGFGGAPAVSLMADLRGERNDRVRIVVYAWYEHNPDPAVLPSLLEAFNKEDSEFVRPALTRAL